MTLINSNRLPGLDGLRCFAALTSLTSHIELWSSSQMLSRLLIENLALKSVDLFFVLSGFLITYLLQNERDTKGEIDVKAFYLRRIFRIWPLYFLVLGIGYLVSITITHEKLYFEGLVLCVLVLPHLALVLYYIPFWASLLWSIGVEEQYYLVWPWVVKHSASKNLLKVVFYCLIGVIGVKLGFWVLSQFEFFTAKIETLRSFLYWFRIECILVGALASVLWYQKNKFLEYLKKRIIRYLTLLLVLVVLLVKSIGPVFSVVDSLIFAVLIVQIVEKPWKLLETSIVKYMGTISYGLYLYHDFAIALSIQLIGLLAIGHDSMLYVPSLYIITFTLTILVSAVSFRYFEKPILQMGKAR